MGNRFVAAWGLAFTVYGAYVLKSGTLGKGDTRKQHGLSQKAVPWTGVLFLLIGMGLLLAAARFAA